MILINDIWYEIYDLHDCVKIIKENYNEELAKEIENLIPEHSDQDYYELHYELQGTYDDLNDDMEKLEDKLDIAETTIEELENRIDELEHQLIEYEE